MSSLRLFDEGVFVELTTICSLRAMELPLPEVPQILMARRPAPAVS